MNYSLSSSRKIGDYIQKVITTQNNTEKATSSALLNTLKAWHNEFATLDASGREVGTIEFKGFTEAPSAGSDNLGSSADITCTVLSTSASLPKTTTFKVNYLTPNTLVAGLNAAFSMLTGSTIYDSNNYLISAILNLH